MYSAHKPTRRLTLNPEQLSDAHLSDKPFLCTIILKSKPAFIVQTFMKQMPVFSRRPLREQLLSSLSFHWTGLNVRVTTLLKNLSTGIFSIFRMVLNPVAYFFMAQVMVTDLKSLFCICSWASWAAEGSNGLRSLRQGFWWITGHARLIFHIVSW